LFNVSKKLMLFIVPYFLGLDNNLACFDGFGVILGWFCQSTIYYIDCFYV